MGLPLCPDQKRDGALQETDFSEVGVPEEIASEAVACHGRSF